MIIPQQQYYINNSRPFDYGSNNNNNELIRYIDQKFKDHEPKSTTLTHETPTKKPEEEPIFFTDEQGDPIESEGSFIAKVSVKRRNNKDHFTFSKAESNNDAISETNEEMPVIIPPPAADDTFGDNSNINESYQPFQDQEITNTGLKPEPEPIPEPVKEEITNKREKRDAFLKQIEEQEKMRKEIKIIAGDYEELKTAFSKNPNEKITTEEWEKFKALAKFIKYDMQKISNKRQRKELALNKLNELEPILKAEIERREQEIKTREEEMKKRFPPGSKGTFQTIQDYAAPVIAAGGGVLKAAGLRGTSSRHNNEL